MSIGNLLKKNIPEFQQGSPQLDSYLESAGEFLDGTKEAIENIDHIHDYKDSTPFFFENTLKDRGYAVPSRIREDVKRRVLRDLAEIHRKNGTLEGIVHAVRMAGLTPEIRVGWLPSPRAVRLGSIVDPVSRIERPYDITRYVYTDLLYGDVVSTPDGVIFEGYRYNDILEEEKIGPLPIFGERYEKTPSNPVSVAKTPYIIVKFQEGNKTIVSDPVVDPETGEIYEYSISEEFQLITDALKYFLLENNRATTMRIIIIVSLQPIEEYLEVDDEFDQTTTYNPDGGDDKFETMNVSDASTEVGTISGYEVVVGSGAFIGPNTPLTSRWFMVSQLIIGGVNDDLTEINAAPENIGVTYHTRGDSVFNFPLRAVCEFTLTPPVNVEVFGVKGEDYGNRELIETITSGEETTIIPDFEYDQIQFEYSSTLSVDVEVGFLFSGFTRQ